MASRNPLYLKSPSWTSLPLSGIHGQGFRESGDLRGGEFDGRSFSVELGAGVSHLGRGPKQGTSVAISQDNVGRISLLCPVDRRCATDAQYLVHGGGFDMAKKCTHLDQIHQVKPSANGCEECLKMGDTWVHLRMCLSCGHVGCCDSSKNKHATKHFRTVHHPIMRSVEPGESWKWCFVDELMFD
jgi:hypothetical protein